MKGGWGSKLSDDTGVTLKFLCSLFKLEIVAQSMSGQTQFNFQYQCAKTTNLQLPVIVSGLFALI